MLWQNTTHHCTGDTNGQNRSRYFAKVIGWTGHFGEKRIRKTVNKRKNLRHAKNSGHTVLSKLILLFPNYLDVGHQPIHTSTNLSLICITELTGLQSIFRWSVRKALYGTLYYLQLGARFGINPRISPSFELMHSYCYSSDFNHSATRGFDYFFT